MQTLKEIIEMRTEETTEFLVKANEDLVLAELEEKFEICQFIMMTKELHLSAEAQVLATETKNDFKVCLQMLKECDDYIYYSIKNSEFH